MIRKKILNNIENDYNSEKELIKKLDITKCKLEETIEQLEKKGYIINKTEKGYKLKDTPDILEPFEIKRKLETKIIGKTIHFYKEVKSTNTIATDFLKNGAEDGTIIVAESQKAGKSRKGREWVSPKGGLWLTMILRPKIEIEYAPRLTLVAGVAVAKSLRENFGLDATIKWPNDILINSRKICGILTEAIIEDDTLEGVLVGVGIDINNDKSSLPEHLQSQTTTMSEE